MHFSSGDCSRIEIQNTSTNWCPLDPVGKVTPAPYGVLFCWYNTGVHKGHHMNWFSEHLLNSTHWIWVRLSEDAPQDPIHRHLTRIFDIGVMDTVNWRLGEEIDFSACPGD